MATISIIAHVNYIAWQVQCGKFEASGSDPLKMTNGCYDSLMSNVLNHCHNICPDKSDIDFIYRRGNS